MLLGLLPVFVGCAEGSFDAKMNAGLQGLLTPRRTPQQELILAVSSEDPDVRRDAVTRIAKSKKYNEEWAIKGLRAIALLESDPQTRCVAIRTLDRSGDARTVEVALMILNNDEYPAREVWPPPPIVRWDAAAALAHYSERDLVPVDKRAEVQRTLQTQLREGHERHTRIAAARGLGNYPDPATVNALIEGLRDDDFAVVYTCEASLVKLTGYTHNCNVLDWETWRDANRDHLFANAGHVPESRRPPYNNRWQKAWYETREFVAFLWPGEKE